VKAPAQGVGPSAGYCPNVQHKNRRTADAGARTRLDNSIVDPAGARALARRIAEGKPSADAFVEPESRQTPSARGPVDGVVYIRPLGVRAERHVRIFVHGPDGRLRRAR
jgi:hypothetical protein